MKFIALTTISEKLVWINANHIVEIYASYYEAYKKGTIGELNTYECTMVALSDSKGIKVKETPEEILRIIDGWDMK